MARYTMLFVLFAAACSEPTTPTPQVELYALTDTVRVTLLPYMQPYNRLTMTMHTGVAAKIHNSSDYIITPHCENSVWRQYPDSLGYTWGQPCLIETTDSYPGNGILPGEDRTFTFSIFSTVSGPQGMPDWNAPTVNGTYRLSIYFDGRRAGALDKPVAFGQAFSNTFEIIENQ